MLFRPHQMMSFSVFRSSSIRIMRKILTVIFFATTVFGADILYHGTLLGGLSEPTPISWGSITNVYIIGPSFVLENTFQCFDLIAEFNDGYVYDISADGAWQELNSIDGVEVSAGVVLVYDIATTEYYTFRGWFGWLEGSWGGEIQLICATNTVRIQDLDELAALPGSSTPLAGVDLSGLDAFTAPVSNGWTAASNTPVVAEFTRQGDSGDTIALSGEDLASFVVYGEGVTNSVAPALLDGRQCAITFPTNLPPNEIYMMWPSNSYGCGEPVVVNQTEAWWVGPDAVSTGETFAIYGRNLDLGSATNFVYCEEYDQWLTNATLNPYRSDFVVPAWTNGTYTLWAHNGKGQEYGWAGSTTLTVGDADGWNSDSNTWLNVNSYSSLSDAINTANATKWSTVYIPAGTETIGDPLVMSDTDYVRIKGDGQTSIIKPNQSTYWSGKILAVSGWDTVVFEDVSFEMGPADNSGALDEALIRFTGCDNLSFIGVKFDNTDANTSYEETYHNTDKRIVQLTSVDGAKFYDCEFLMKAPMSFEESTQIIISNCTFKGRNDVTYLVNHREQCYETAIIDCHFQNYDDSDLSQAYNRCVGRCIYGKYPWRDFYVGGTTTTNMAVYLSDNYDLNAGEQIMYEDARTLHLDDIASATASTVVFEDTPPSTLLNEIVTIQDGRGLGQSRRITDVNTTTKTITVSPDWNVIPDDTSVGACGYYAHRIAIYDNYLDGREENVSTGTHNASFGVNIYGGGSQICIDNNTINQLRYGIDLRARHRSGLYEVTCFNFINNNVVKNGTYGLNVVQNRNPDASVGPLQYFVYPQNFANAWRGNTVTNSADASMRFGGTYDSSYTGERIDFQVWQDNVLSDHARPLSYHRLDNGTPREVVDPSEVHNQIYIGNTTNGVAWSPE